MKATGSEGIVSVGNAVILGNMGMGAFCVNSVSDRVSMVGKNFSASGCIYRPCATITLMFGLPVFITFMVR